MHTKSSKRMAARNKPKPEAWSRNGLKVRAKPRGHTYNSFMLREVVSNPQSGPSGQNKRRFLQSRKQCPVVSLMPCLQQERLLEKHTISHHFPVTNLVCRRKNYNFVGLFLSNINVFSILV